MAIQASCSIRLQCLFQQRKGPSVAHSPYTVHSGESRAITCTAVRPYKLRSSWRPDTEEMLHTRVREPYRVRTGAGRHVLLFSAGQDSALPSSRRWADFGRKAAQISALVSR